MKKLLALITILSLASGCSRQWIETDPGVDSAMALEELNRIISSPSASSSGNSMALINQMLDDPTLSLYYAESGSAMGPAAALFSFHDLDWFGLQGQDVFYAGIEQVKIIFLDSYVNNSRYFALIVEAVDGAGNQNVFAEVSAPDDYAFTDEDFVTRIPGKNGLDLILRTNFVSDDFGDELDTNIQLQAFQQDANGSEALVGQFSVLAGFGGAR